MPINNKALDRRVKLTDAQRVEIKLSSLSTRRLAEVYNVSRRTIQFTKDLDKLKENKKRREERGGWKQYHNKDDHASYMRGHRDYKKELFNTGKL